jgi:hypothetical protein
MALCEPDDRNLEHSDIVLKLSRNVVHLRLVKVGQDSSFDISENNDTAARDHSIQAKTLDLTAC